MLKADMLFLFTALLFLGCSKSIPEGFYEGSKSEIKRGYNVITVLRVHIKNDKDVDYTERIEIKGGESTQSSYSGTYEIDKTSIGTFLTLILPTHPGGRATFTVEDGRIILGDIQLLKR